MRFKIVLIALKLPSSKEGDLLIQYMKVELEDVSMSDISSSILDVAVTDFGRMRLTEVAMQKLLDFREEDPKNFTFYFIYLLKSESCSHRVPDNFKIVDVEVNEDLVKIERKEFCEYLRKEHVNFEVPEILQPNVFALIDKGHETKYYLDFENLEFSRFCKDSNRNIHKTEYHSVLSLTASFSEVALLEQPLIDSEEKIEIDIELSQVLEVTENITLSYSEILKLISAFDLSFQYTVQQMILERIRKNETT